MRLNAKYSGVQRTKETDEVENNKGLASEESGQLAPPLALCASQIRKESLLRRKDIPYPVNSHCTTGLWLELGAQSCLIIESSD